MNFVAIYYEKSASRNAFPVEKKHFPNRNLLKASNTKKLNCKLGESTFINLSLHFIFAYLITVPILQFMQPCLRTQLIYIHLGVEKQCGENVCV